MVAQLEKRDPHCKSQRSHLSKIRTSLLKMQPKLQKLKSSLATWTMTKQKNLSKLNKVCQTIRWKESMQNLLSSKARAKVARFMTWINLSWLSCLLRRTWIQWAVKIRLSLVLFGHACQPSRNGSATLRGTRTATYCSARTSRLTNFPTATPYSIASSKRCAAQLRSAHSTKSNSDRGTIKKHRGSDRNLTSQNSIARSSNTTWSWSSMSSISITCSSRWRKTPQQLTNSNTSRNVSSYSWENLTNSLQQWCPWPCQIEMLLASSSSKFSR